MEEGKGAKSKKEKLELQACKAVQREEGVQGSDQRLVRHLL